MVEPTAFLAISWCYDMSNQEMLWPTYRPAVPRPVAAGLAVVGSAARPATVKTSRVHRGRASGLAGVAGPVPRHHGIATRGVHQDEERFAESMDLAGQPLAGVGRPPADPQWRPGRGLLPLAAGAPEGWPALPAGRPGRRGDRAHVYGAIRLGAKAFVTLDAEPAEIVRRPVRRRQQPVPDAGGDGRAGQRRLLRRRRRAVARAASPWTAEHSRGGDHPPAVRGPGLPRKSPATCTSAPRPSRTTATTSTAN